MLIRNRLSAVLLALLMSACATTEKDPTTGWSVDKIYAEAREEMSNLQFEKAATLFEKLEGRAAGTPLAQQAQLEKAYAYYKNKDTALAVSILDRYIKIHPSSPALDYALYLKGVVNFNEEVGFLELFSKQDMSDRDQKAAKESFEAFKELVTRFPDSKYSEDARLRMAYMVDTLARSEVNVARYYHKRGAYVAAVNRLQVAIQDYQGTATVKDALELLADCYDKMGLVQLRDDTRRVLLTNFPTTIQTKSVPRPWWKLW
ncbi:MAG: outer membrane protein assembly factor BamD [Alphaproteobacteria bacterium]|nr:outer membrane protein assembly factor BamD [Alphaproteobacteria bacterium]